MPPDRAPAQEWVGPRNGARAGECGGLGERPRAGEERFTTLGRGAAPAGVGQPVVAHGRRGGREAGALRRAAGDGRKRGMRLGPSTRNGRRCEPAPRAPSQRVEGPPGAGGARWVLPPEEWATWLRGRLEQRPDGWVLPVEDDLYRGRSQPSGRPLRPVTPPPGRFGGRPPEAGLAPARTAAVLGGRRDHGVRGLAPARTAAVTWATSGAAMFGGWRLPGGPFSPGRPARPRGSGLAIRLGVPVVPAAQADKAGKRRTSRVVPNVASRPDGWHGPSRESAAREPIEPARQGPGTGGTAPYASDM